MNAKDPASTTTVTPIKLGEDENEFEKEFYSYLQPNDDEKAALKVMDEIKASFNRMDLNKNGYLSKEEIKEGFSNKNFELADEGIEWILENIDNDGADNINLGEYVQFLAKLTDKEDFRKTFFFYLNRRLPC